MGVIHSDKLAALALTGGGTIDTLYTVAADEVVILRDWRFYNGAAAARVVNLDLLSGAVRVRLASAAAMVALGVLKPDRQEWLVLEAGDKIEASADLANVRVWVSGTRLTPP